MLFHMSCETNALVFHRKKHERGECLLLNALPGAFQKSKVGPL